MDKFLFFKEYRGFFRLNDGFLTIDYEISTEHIILNIKGIKTWKKDIRMGRRSSRIPCCRTRGKICYSKTYKRKAAAEVQALKKRRMEEEGDRIITKRLGRAARGRTRSTAVGSENQQPLTRTSRHIPKTSDSTHPPPTTPASGTNSTKASFLL